MSEQAQALARLREILKPGDTLHGIQRHRSRSGASCSVSLVVPVNGALVDLDADVALALGLQLDKKHGGIRVYNTAAGVTVYAGAAVVSQLAVALGYALRHRQM